MSSPSQVRRRGAAPWPVIAVVASLVLLGVLLASLGNRPAQPGGNASPAAPPLTIFCAASNKGVVEAIRRDYEQEFGRPVQVQFGASQSLLASLEVSKSGDLCLPADESFLDVARERQLIDEVFPLAEMRVVVAVPKGNPQRIEKLADLLSEDVRVAQGNIEATAIGKVTHEALAAAGLWDTLQEHTTVFKTNVNEVANDVKLGAVDAGIVYDVVLHDYETLEGVTIPELSSIRSRVAVALLKSSTQPDDARHLARYLSASDRGLVRYREFGFHVVEGIAWKN